MRLRGIFQAGLQPAAAAGGEGGEDLNTGAALWKQCGRHCSSHAQLLFSLFKWKNQTVFFLWGKCFWILYLNCTKSARCLPVQFIAGHSPTLAHMLRVHWSLELRTGCYLCNSFRNETAVIYLPSFVLLNSNNKLTKHFETHTKKISDNHL